MKVSSRTIDALKFGGKLEKPLVLHGQGLKFKKYGEVRLILVRGRETSRLCILCLSFFFLRLMSTST